MIPTTHQRPLFVTIKSIRVCFALVGHENLSDFPPRSNLGRGRLRLLLKAYPGSLQEASLVLSRALGLLADDKNKPSSP